MVIENAAQAVDSYYTGKDGVKRALGSIGHIAAFSFHETKNIISGEGGMLVLNDDRFIERAEIIWEKGHESFGIFQGEVDKYGWVDIGSSFLPSELIAAFLWAQLEKLEDIQNKRLEIWNFYLSELQDWSRSNDVSLPLIPEYATNNAHMFYMVCKNSKQRKSLLKTLKDNDILAVFHYLSLHKSKFYKNKHDGRQIPLSDNYSNHLVRLPLYYELTTLELNKIVNTIKSIGD